MDVISDDAHKGSTDGDQADLYEIEVFNWSTGNGYWLGLWKAPFSGVNRANAVINYLVINYNVEANRLIAATKGEESPLSVVTQISGGVELGESINRLAEINRRVDFEIAN